jgi:hypothetical protein
VVVVSVQSAQTQARRQAAQVALATTSAHLSQVQQPTKVLVAVVVARRVVRLAQRVQAQAHRVVPQVVSHQQTQVQVVAVVARVPTQAATAVQESSISVVEFLVLLWEH